MDKLRIIVLPKFSDNRGSLSFIEQENQIPFEIKRVFWTYDVPGGDVREGHAYKTQSELIVALSGSFMVEVIHKDGTKDEFLLNRSNYGLFIPSGVWRQLDNFSTNAVSLHLSDMEYDPSDYIRNLKSYLNEDI